MKALAAAGPGQVAMVHVPIPVPGPGAIRVKVAVSAVSAGTEMFALARATANTTKRLGYMVAGVVDAVGEGVSLLKVGDRVCGMLGPGHAEFCVGEQMRAARVPEDVSFLDAACSYWAVPAMRGVHRMELRLFDDAAVIGQGPIGLMATQMLKQIARKVVAVDVIDTRLDKARELGATHTWNASSERPAQLPQPQAVLVASGSEGAFKTACQLVRPRGRVVFLRMPSAAPNLDMEALTYAKDVELIPTGQPGMFPHPSYVHAETSSAFTRALEVYPESWHFQRYVAAVVEMVQAKRLDMAAVATTVASHEEAPEIMEHLYADPTQYLGVAFRW